MSGSGLSCGVRCVAYHADQLCIVSKKNPYDLRIPCKDPNGVCYEEVNWISDWMNQPDVKRALGVDDSPVGKFVSCNMTTNMGFYAQGQAMHNSAALLPEIIKADIRLLAFAGDTGAPVPQCEFQATQANGDNVFRRCVQPYCAWQSHFGWYRV